MTDDGGPIFDEAFLAQLELLLRWRRDIRHFRPDKVAPEILSHLLELADLAPSVGLSQPWRFVLVDDAARRTAIRENFEACNAAALAEYDGGQASLYARLKLEGLSQAPCHLAIFAEETTRQGAGLGKATMPETIRYSAAMAAHTLWLAARAVGIGLGWVSILDPRAAAATLDVPEDWTLVGYFCLGYPAGHADVPELETVGWESRSPASSRIVQR